MLEYIPGDFVIIETESAKPRIVKVSTVDEDSVIYCEGWGEVRFYDKIKPIPLTPEILEKNGWEFDNATWIYKKGYIRVFRLLDDKTYAAYIHGVRVFEFNFIHELQHLLFGLGINSEMEV